MGEDSTAPQSGRKVMVDEAARHLGLSVDAGRKRVQRGQLPHEKDLADRVRIILHDSETPRNESPDTLGQSAELVGELQDRIRYLGRQVEEREARRRADTILAQLSAANAEQARTIRALEPPAPPESPEPREEPETHPAKPEKAEPADPVDPQREEPERVRPERVEPERTEPRESPVTAADEQQGWACPRCWRPSDGKREAVHGRARAPRVLVPLVRRASRAGQKIGAYPLPNLLLSAFSEVGVDSYPGSCIPPVRSGVLDRGNAGCGFVEHSLGGE